MLGVYTQLFRIDPHSNIHFNYALYSDRYYRSIHTAIMARAYAMVLPGCSCKWQRKLKANTIPNVIGTELMIVIRESMVTFRKSCVLAESR